MGTNEYSQPASKSSWDSQDFGDIKMVLKTAHFNKSSRPQWVNQKWHWKFEIVPFHNDFSPSGEQTEQCKSAHTS